MNLKVIIFLILLISNKSIKKFDKPEIDNTNKENNSFNKNLFPLDRSELLAIFLLCIITVLGLIAGVGGGIFIIPLATFILGMNIKQATGFSNFLMLINSFIRYLSNIFRKDPNKPHKTIIDYDIVLIFNPILLVGTVFGIIINNIIPEILVLILLWVTIFLGWIKTTKKTLKLYKKEKKLLKMTKDPDPKNNKPIDNSNKNWNIKIESNNNIDIHIDKWNTNSNNSSNQNDNIHKDILLKNKDLNINDSKPIENLSKSLNNNKIDDDNKVLKKIKKSESKNFHPFKFTIILTTIIISVLVTLFKGKNGSASIIGIQRCTLADYLLYIIYVIASIVILLISIKHVYRFNKLKINNNFLYDHEIIYTKKNIAKISIISFFIGFIAALTGIGGSVITTPFLYSLGYSPLLTSNVSLFLVFINKIGSVIGNGIDGYIIWKYALFYGIFIIIISICSEKFLKIIIKKMKKQSIISFTFIFLISISFILITFKLIGVAEGNNIFIFKSFCN